jgi:hypothetical protein
MPPRGTKPACRVRSNFTDEKLRALTPGRAVSEKTVCGRLRRFVFDSGGSENSDQLAERTRTVTGGRLVDGAEILAAAVRRAGRRDNVFSVGGNSIDAGTLSQLIG